MTNQIIKKERDQTKLEQVQVVKPAFKAASFLEGGKGEPTHTHTHILTVKLSAPTAPNFCNIDLSNCRLG
jgi:hypothetical protein